MYEVERELIVRDLSGLPSRLTAMVRKNWKRYACVAALVEKRVPRERPLKILDYGCGYPIVLKLLRMRGYFVVGFEPYAEAEQFATAEALGVSQHYSAELHAGDRFDVALLVDVVEHLAVPAPTFRNLSDHVADDVLLLVSTPNVLRFETYWSFVMRRTGHPTPLEHYLNAENTYVHHQRELTVHELQRLLGHFGYRLISSEFNDTRPDPVDLAEYHGDPGTGRRKGLKGRVFDLTRRWLPSSLANDNILVVAQRVAKESAL